jgi:hypothetical protein
MTSKKDYEAFAEHIRNLPPKFYPVKVRNSMACMCCILFSRDNDLFDWKRFYAACGL